MHLYWRVQNDLDCLGEVIHFHDPKLTRCLRLWMRKNMAGLAMAMGLYPHEGLGVSGN
ncbi:conserved hypothetical protein [Desulfosarcina cetonica]|nr:conserved hypothetical protein [Desulfosarcina cetonica]